MTLRSSPSPSAPFGAGRGEQRRGGHSADHHASRIGTLSGYGAFIRWMIADAFWRFRWLVLGVIVSGSAAVALQVKAIALTIYYTRLFERNETFELLGWSFDVRRSIALLVGFGAVALLALLASAAMQYASRVWTLWFRRRYAEVCSIRVLNILEGAPHTVPAGPIRFDDTVASALARSESLFGGRMVSIAIGVITPVISFVASIAVLFYIHWPLTLLLMVMIGLCGIFLYHTNVKAAEHSRAAEKLSRGAMAEIRKMVQRHKSWPGVAATAALAATPLPSVASGTDLSDAERAVRSDPIEPYFNAYVARLRVVADSELIGNIFLAVVLAIIMVALGASAILSGRGWESMVVYLVALRYALVTFRGGIRTVTSFNRFYPQVRRYYDFLRFTTADASAEVATKAQLPDRYVLRTAGEPLFDDSIEQAEIRPGERLALCAPIDINRYTLPFILGCLLGSDGQTSPAVVRAILGRAACFTSAARLPEGPLSQTLGYTPEMWDQLKDLAERTSLHRKLAERFPDGPATVISGDGRDGIHVGLKFILMLVPALRRPTDWMFLDGNDLSILDAEVRDELLNRLSGSVVVILYNEAISLAGDAGEQLAAVHNADAQVGLGTIKWLKQHELAVQTMLATAVPTRKGRLEDDDEDEDDADDL